MALSDLPDVLGLEERGTMPPDMSGETSNMTGVGDQSPSLSQSLAQDMPAMMTQSMCIPSGTPMDPTPDIMTSSTSSLQQGRKGSGLRNQTSQNWFTFDDVSADNAEGRAESAAREKEREERVRKMREMQEEERKRKLEELKMHAQKTQKFREQQEADRRRHIDELRSKDMDRRQQVEERRRDIERSEQERREAIIQRNKEREDRLENQRRSSRGNIDFAFGSSAPRLIEPRVDSASGYWGSRRSTSSNNVGSHSGALSFDRRSQERDQTDFRSKRTASAQGLDRSTEGEENGLVATTTVSAHRRRTDLVPTLTMKREDHHAPGSASTPRRSPGLSRENSSSSRPGSALSTPARGVGGAGSGSGVRMRPGSSGGRRPRPLSIATTGMTASMYEERQRPTVSHVPRQKSTGTPKPDRMKRARSVTSDAGTGIDDDNRSTTSSQSVDPARTPSRRTPSQVKAEAAARKAKASPAIQSTSRPQLSTPKSSLGAKKENGKRKGSEGGASKSPSPAVSQDHMESGVGAAGGADTSTRQSTPDILKDNNKKPSEPREIQEPVQEEGRVERAVSQEADRESGTQKEEQNQEEEKEQAVETEEDGLPNNEEVKEKKIITSEEEAKARIAEKRREMKEQKEREAEMERLRLEEEARLEEEQRRKEEEEMKELERLAEEGRRAEEERIQKAIQEKEEEEKRAKEEEERLRKEKEETEKKTKEEAEKRESELQEKLKKEEEERLARKKRIEEIMARTRGKGAAPSPAKKEEEVSSSPPQQPASLDPMGDPTKPDLLGDISDKVEAENARNLAQVGPSPPSPADSEPEVEKGALDSLSLKSEDTENSSPIITIENGVPSKKSNGCVDGSSFDQILDLGDMADSNKEKAPGVPSPIRAFEENSQHNNAGALGARDLLS